MKRPKFNIGDKVTLTFNGVTYGPTVILGRYWGDNYTNREISGNRECHWYYIYNILEIDKEPVVSIERGNIKHRFKLELVERLNLVSPSPIKKVTL